MLLVFQNFYYVFKDGGQVRIIDVKLICKLGRCKNYSKIHPQKGNTLNLSQNMTFLLRFLPIFTVQKKFFNFF